MANRRHGQVWRIAVLATVLGAVGLWATLAARPFFILSGQSNPAGQPEFAIVLVSMVVGTIAVAALVIATVIAAFWDYLASRSTDKVEPTRSSRRPNPA